jgi:hypothetical protein
VQVSNLIIIYTKKILCQKPIITLNDKHFNTNVSSEYLDTNSRDLMLSVDGAEIINEEQWLITTRLGTGDIRNLSTGLKTLINIYNLKKCGGTGTVDIREVGENLVPQLLLVADDSGICLYTGNYNFIGLVDEGYEFTVDDVHQVIGTVALSLKLEEIRGRKKC